MAYDAELGKITDRDREYAEDLLYDLCIKHGENRLQIVAEWLRKHRYESVIADRRKRLIEMATLEH